MECPYCGFETDNVRLYVYHLNRCLSTYCPICNKTYVNIMSHLFNCYRRGDILHNQLYFVFRFYRRKFYSNAVVIDDLPPKNKARLPKIVFKK